MEIFVLFKKNLSDKIAPCCKNLVPDYYQEKTDGTD
jgi:hypothetical protein